MITVVGHDGDSRDGAGAREVVEQVREDGTAADLDQRLRRVGEQRADAGAVARGEEHGIQGRAVEPAAAARAAGVPDSSVGAPLRVESVPGSAGTGTSAAATRTGTTVNPSSR